MKTSAITPNTRFYEDMTNPERVTSVNGKPMPIGYWNLIVSIRDCGLYSKGIKPHRFWKISQVKEYFGVKGSAEKIHETLKTWQEYLVQA